MAVPSHRWKPLGALGISRADEHISKCWLQRWLLKLFDGFTVSTIFFHVSIYLSIYLSIYVHDCSLIDSLVYSGRSHRCRRKYYYSDQAGFHGTRLLETTKIHSGRSKDTISDFSDLFFFKKEQLWIE